MSVFLKFPSELILKLELIKNIDTWLIARFCIVQKIPKAGHGLNSAVLILKSGNTFGVS